LQLSIRKKIEQMIHGTGLQLSMFPLLMMWRRKGQTD